MGPRVLQYPDTFKLTGPAQAFPFQFYQTPPDQNGRCPPHPTVCALFSPFPRHFFSKAETNT
jgi:hypothetical protein